MVLHTCRASRTLMTCDVFWRKTTTQLIVHYGSDYLLFHQGLSTGIPSLCLTFNLLNRVDLRKLTGRPYKCREILNRLKWGRHILYLRFFYCVLWNLKSKKDEYVIILIWHIFITRWWKLYLVCYLFDDLSVTTLCV